MNGGARWSTRHRQMLAEMGASPWVGLEPDPAAGPPSHVSPPKRSQAPARPATEAQALPPPMPGSVAAHVAAHVAAPAAAPAASPPTPAPLATPRAAVQAAGAADDWIRLRSEVAACTACGLCEGRRQTVFGVGAVRSDLMIVGEAPGAEEDARGEPFVGVAGQLLDRMLASIGRSRDADAGAGQGVFIANTLKCRPPGNRNPQPEEIAQCRPFLLRQIALLQPRLIFAVGRFAVDVLLRDASPIGRLRGRVHAAAGLADLPAGVPVPQVVVGYHPAYLLRQPQDKAKAWDDLRLLAARLAEPGGG